MATLEELYKLRKIFRDYEAPIPEKLKKEIREKETPYLKELNEIYSAIVPHELPIKELSEKILISLEYDGCELKAIYSCGLEDETSFLDNMIKTEITDEPETPDEVIEEEGEDIEELDEDEYTVITRSGKSPTTPFKVIFLDEGKTIKGKDAITTMIETLKYMGLSRVAGFRGMLFKGFPLVGKTRRTDLSKKGKEVNWQKWVDGWWIYSQITNKTKKRVIEKVGAYLGHRIEVVDL